MDSVDILWQKYTKSKNKDIKEKLILNYLQLVNYIAGRVSLQVGYYVDYDDLVSYGIFGLIDAINKYDYKTGNKFETYASLRIRGEILDNIRKLDWVPRLVRQKNKKLQQAYADFENAYEREPTEEELANILETTKKDIQETMANIKFSNYISLDEYKEKTGEETWEISKKIAVPELELNRNEIKKELKKALDDLTEKEKYVISLYYYEDLTLKEISKILEVSESRISQIHTKALFKLQNKLENYELFMF